MKFGTIERPGAALLDAFRRIPTSTLSDVLDTLGIPGVIMNLDAVPPESASRDRR